MLYSIERFNRDVWRPSMRQIVWDIPQRMLSGTFGETTLRVYSLAGRVMLTFERRKGETQITLVGADNVDRNAGLQSYEGEMWEHSDMIDDVICRWTGWSDDQRRTKLAPDAKQVMV